jgi:hypothetical protein
MGPTSPCSHLAMSSRRDDAETCSENCASPPRDLLKTCSPCGAHVFIVAVLSQHKQPCSPRGDHDHFCRRQLLQPRTPCDAHDRLPCRTALTTSNTLRCPRPCSPPCSSRDGLTFRCSPSRSWLRSPYNHQRLSTFTFVRAAGWPRSVFVFRRSRHARLHGACVHVRLSTFASASTLRFQRRPFLRTALVNPFARSHFVLLLAKQTKRAHLLVLVSAFVFRRSRPDALRRLTVHGLASSFHVSTARSSDPLSVRGPPLHAAPVNRSHARLATFTFVRAAGWPRSVFVFRRSRHARLHGACVYVCLSTLAFAFTLRFQRRPFLRTFLVNPFARSHFVLLLAKQQTKRAHLLVLVSAFIFRCSRPDALHRLTVHGLARSCHVSTAQSSDPLSVRGPSPRAAPVNHGHAHLATIMIVLPYGFLRAQHTLRHAPPDETQSRFRVVSTALGRDVRASRGLNLRLCLGIQIDLHLSTLTIQSTSVLTLAQRFRSKKSDPKIKP